MKPKQDMPELLESILAFLAKGKTEKPGRIACHLLNLADKEREEFAQSIEQSIKLTLQKQRPQLVSIFGSINLTMLCHLQNIQFDESIDFMDYPLADIYIADETHRIFLEIFFDGNLEIMDIKYSELSSQDIDEQKRKRIQFLAEKLKKQRINARLSKSKKIGRNDQCPCGSGQKYKNCCQKT